MIDNELAQPSGLAEPTEIIEHPDRTYSNYDLSIPGITALPVKMTKILKFKHLFHYYLQRILCNVTAKLSLMKDHKGLLFVYLFVCFIKN